jgi:tetratricopeptide (TPR) repeat protein
MLIFRAADSSKKRLLIWLNLLLLGIKFFGLKHLLLLLFATVATWAQPDFSAAEKLFQQGNYEQAKVQFEKFLVSHPNHIQAIEYLGDIQGHQKHWEQAMAYYAKLKQLRPSEADYYYKYGGVLGMHAKESNKFKALGMIGDIRKSFEKAIALNPKHIDARWALIELYLQLPGIVGGSEAKAQVYANELEQLSPVDGYLAKGRIAEYFERYKTAEKFYKLAVETGGSKTTYQKLADLYKNKMNQPEKAKATLAEFNNKKKS